MRIISLFSGVGGLDLGFSSQGFNLVFANDKDKDVWETFEKNHPIKINKGSIRDIDSKDIPEADGILGGPPCQSWSLAGAMRGVNDPRGSLFYEYLRVLEDKQPMFFVAENVAGIVSKTHFPEFQKIVGKFEEIGYKVNWELLNAKDYSVPQERKRVIVVGYRNDLGKKFEFPLKNKNLISLNKTLKGLPKSTPAKGKNKPNENLEVLNHEHMVGTFSTIYMSRNRRKKWDSQSFTIQAGGRHAPLHPSSTEMVKIGKDCWEFKNGKSSPHRRMSVRECARIQTFPDDFIFKYDQVAKGYKMVGNAVPVKLAEAIGKKIKQDLF